MNNESKPGLNISENKLTKKKLIKFPFALWEELEAKAKEENQDNMSEFIRHICRSYLKGDLGKVQTRDLEIEQLLAEQRKLQEEDHKFLSNLNSLLRSAKNEPKPEKYEEKKSRVMKAIGTQKLQFDDIADITQIPKEELIILIGNLVDSMEIAFDEYWRYHRA